MILFDNPKFLKDIVRRVYITTPDFDKLILFHFKMHVHSKKKINRNWTRQSRDKAAGSNITEKHPTAARNNRD